MTTRFPRIRRDLSRMGLGVVQVATRATNQRAHAQRVALFNDLVSDGQVGVLSALLHGRISWDELLEHKRKSGFVRNDALSDIALSVRLSVAVATHLPQMGRGEKGRTRYRNALTQLVRRVGDIPVRELETVPWEPLMAAHEAEGRSGADWNHMRRAISALLTAMLGKIHPTRYAIVKSVPLRPEPHRVPDLTPSVFAQLVAASPAHIQASLYTLLLTGMRTGEYVRCTRQHLMPETCAVRVPGTKTEKSAGVVMVDPSLWGWIEAGVPSRLKYTALRQWFMRACLATGHGQMVLKRTGKMGYVGLRLHDLRHALAQWSSDSAVPLTQVQAQMRHASLAMTGRYAERSGARAVATKMGELLKAKGE